MRNNCCAIITARGGSKRIPDKNIKLFNGRPIISYSINVAFESGLFEDVIVSTDSLIIEKVARDLGANVPFRRSVQNSDDFSTTSDVLIEVLDNLAKQGRNYKYICCIYPTAPMITKDILTRGFELLLENSFDSVFPISEFSAPIFRSLKINTDNKLEYNWPEYKNTRSQDIEKAYFDAGQFYWINVETFLQNKDIVTNNSGGIILNQLIVQDIDNEEDWIIAELKHQLNIGKFN
jgi:N-acylneuraminate cytidylyltransferase